MPFWKQAQNDMHASKDGKQKCKHIAYRTMQACHHSLIQYAMVQSIIHTIIQKYKNAIMK